MRPLNSSTARCSDCPSYSNTPFSCSVANTMVTLADGFVLNGSSSTNELLWTKLRLVRYSHLFPGQQHVTQWKKEVKQSPNRPGVAQRVPGGLGSHISMTFGTWSWWGCQPHAPAAFTPVKFLVLIFTRGWVDPRAMVWSEGNMSLKNPVTPPGIDPGTVRLVAQCLNHYTTPGPCIWHNTKHEEEEKDEGLFAVMLVIVLMTMTVTTMKGKGKAIPLQAWTGPEGSRRLKLPDFKTIGTWRL